MGRLCKGRAAEQNEGRGEIKPFSCFHWPVLLYGPYFKGAPICPRRPEAPGGKSSNGWRLASSTGNLTPRVVLTQPPPLPATDHGGKPLQRSDVRLDGSIIVPAAGYGRTGSRPVLAACCFSLLAGKNKPKTYNFFFRWCLVVFSRQITAQPLPGLWLSPKQRECA